MTAEDAYKILVKAMELIDNIPVCTDEKLEKQLVDIDQSILAARKTLRGKPKDEIIDAED